MFIEPQEFSTAQELRNHYRQVRKRIYTPPAPKATPKPEKRAIAWPSAPDRHWSFIGPIELPTVHGMTIDKIIHAVCGEFNVREMDLRGPRRFHNVTYPRMIVFYLAREKTTASFPTIGRILGGRDHSTVLSGCKKIDRLLKSGDERTVKTIAAIERALAS